MTQVITIFEEKGATISATSKQLIDEIRTLKIVNEGDEQVAVDAREKVRVCIKRIEELRKQAVTPFNEEVKRVNNQAKLYTEPLEKAFAAVTKVIKDYMDEQARIAEEKARKLRQEQEEKERQKQAEIDAALKKQKELEEQAKKASFAEQENLERKAREEAKKAEEAQAELDKKEVQMVEAAPKSVRTESGAKATRKLNWTWELLDINELYKKRPDLFILDEKKMNKLVKEGEREIPGVRIFQESSLSA